MTDLTKGITAGLSKPLTAALRKAASAAGWDSMIVSQLTVIAEDSGISIEYPEHLAEKIEDLEYGTIDTPPLPVFRTFLTKNSAVFENTVTESLVDNLFEAGVLP